VPISNVFVVIGFVIMDSACSSVSLDCRSSCYWRCAIPCKHT